MDFEPQKQSPVTFSDDTRRQRINQKNGMQSLLENIWGLFKFVAAVTIMVLLINAFGFQSYEVFGQSMHPTLNTGDRLLISKLGKTIDNIGEDTYVPQRGDIVVFKDPRSNSMQLIKRVIGLPGERVLLEDGIFTVFNDEKPNGFNPDPNFEVDFLYTSGLVDISIPDGEIFVSGDNRQQGGSLDSRNELGTVPIDNIVGELVLRIYPLSEASLY